ncbi:hypothetical protein Cthiooxydans_15510 [Comamonas thiooxydans]|uniref:LamG domain-containing protein n=1 Tax=Comamonas thiooxydans TaxID=363952 RepID=UPI001E5AA988|nr:LamG domain-containing protein [Comamonas thiooxydans]BDB69139.1 hypothetical protein Cthiooxydans_15510 [Comamonas thiooxydans]
MASIWRVVGIKTLGADLDLTEVQLRSQGVRVDAGAVITASVAAITGSPADLLDGSTATGCRWAATDVRQPGFWIQIALAGDMVDELFFGGSSVPVRVAVVPPAPQAVRDVWPTPVAGGVWFRLGFALDAILAAAPVAAWRMDDPGGTQADLIGSRTGTRTGGVTASTAITMGTSGSFDPQTSGLISMPAGAFDAGAFSIVIDVQTTNSVNLVVAEHGSDNKGWSIQFSDAGNAVNLAVPGGIMFLVGYNNGGGISASRVAYNDGRPHRLVCTFVPGVGRRLYIDGVLDSRDSESNGNPTYNGANLHYGSRGGATGLPAGSLLGAFAVFDRALTPAEVRAICGTDAVVRAAAMRESKSLVVPSETLPPPQGLQGINTTQTAKARDIEFGGIGRIYGTVARKNAPANVPLRRRVRLHRSVDGYLARETWSKADGSYEFTEISTRYEWDVIAWDHERQEYSTVANNQLAEVMS